MQKKLTAKTQKLAKKLPQEARDFSTTLVIEPEEQDLIEKKGSLYILFDVSSQEVLDPLLITKVVNDVLHDSYYGSESSSPMQSLERALVDVKDKVTHLPGSKSKDYGVSEFNILAAVLWGNVLYMVQFGKGGSFLVRNNQVKPVNTSTEGSFSVASGVIKDEDVVILGTHSFNQRYKAEDLISGNISISMHDLADSAAALLLKFEVVAELTEEEKIDFGSEVEFDEVKEDRKKSSLELAKKMPKNLPKISISKVGKSKIKPYQIVVLLLGLLLVGSIFWTFKNKDSPEEETSIEDSMVSEESKEEVALVDEVDTSKDEQFKINRISPQVFYDLKLTDETSSPTDIVALDAEIIVSDKSSGKVFVSSSTTPKFEETGKYTGIDGLLYFGGDLVFVDSEGYKVFDKPIGTEGTVTESYAGSSIGPAAPYLAYLYAAEEDQIIKYSLLDSGLEASTWAQSEEVKGSIDLAIDGSIYLLKENDLIEFFSGTKTDFEITGLDKDLSGATKVLKTFNLENIYIADSGNNRVVVLNEAGEVVNQYLANDGELDNIKSLTVSPDETFIYVLSGTRVLEIEL